ncbi:hypothetical protein MMC13_006360 [Lambiella insularis]|nr:hypothetical protein [Lambiella insularis]
MSLRTGTSLAILTLLLNKLSALYGLLALLTGLHLSPLQLSMYIYSLFALIATAYLAPHIRSQSPFHCLALAWLYVVDTLINVVYTALFAVTWFMVLAQHQSQEQVQEGTPGAGGQTINDTAGFTSPKYNVSHVGIVGSSTAGLSDAVAVGAASGTAAGVNATIGVPTLGHGFQQPESKTSAVVVLTLLLIRLYLMFIVISYARYVLHRSMSRSQWDESTWPTHNEKSGSRQSPFSKDYGTGKGWKGVFGRAMLKVGKSYWLGGELGSPGASPEKTRPLCGRVEELDGILQRERRRRSGTSPRPPLAEVSGSNQAQPATTERGCIVLAANDGNVPRAEDIYSAHCGSA